MTNLKLIHAFAALADLGQEIADTSDFREMIRTSLHLLLGSLAIRRGALAEFDASKQRLHFIALRSVTNGNLPSLALDNEDIGDLRHAGLSAIPLENGKSRQLFRFCLRHRSLLIATETHLLIPLIVREQLVGLVLLGEKLTGEPYTSEDDAILCALARHIGVGLQRYALTLEVQRQAKENHSLSNNLRDLYRNTVRALATAMDAKDKVTQGHAERVGLYCSIIARELGWNEEEIEGMTIAGYLHDIGKLVVERELINAPYPVDAKRCAELQRHPLVGYDILLPIKHPYIDIAATARYHHERPDGTGYPEGLTDQRIPLSAKIVAVADAFDGMTTAHPYRPRRDIETVLRELYTHAGTQFDNHVVAAFARALLRELDTEETHQHLVRTLERTYLRPQHIEPTLNKMIKELAAR